MISPCFICSLLSDDQRQLLKEFSHSFGLSPCSVIIFAFRLIQSISSNL